MSTDEREGRYRNLSEKAATVFTPAAPIRHGDLFADRPEQVQQVIGAINSVGQHAILFGERGVGKTSLANILADRVFNPGGRPVVTPRVNCTHTDTYGTVWANAIERLSKGLPVRAGVGFGGGKKPLVVPGNVTPHTVRDLLHRASEDALVVVVLDEFDRLTDAKSKTLFADTVKALSDDPCCATLLFVGVGDTVEQLIADHQSIGRALVQVRMPRMSRTELKKIIANGLEKLGMRIDSSAQDDLVTICQGLPHYAHVLGLNACREALARQSYLIAPGDFDKALSVALKNAQETIRASYYRAVHSQRKPNRFEQVLLACAMTQTDEMGLFSPVDVREPFATVLRRPIRIPAFTRHLADFCHHARGPVLKRVGVDRRFRYRFADPLMQPYVVMRGVGDRTITRQELSHPRQPTPRRIEPE